MAKIEPMLPRQIRQPMRREHTERYSRAGSKSRARKTGWRGNRSASPINEPLSWPGREAAGDITMKRLRTAPGRETRNGDSTFLSARAAEGYWAAAIVALFDPPFRFSDRAPPDARGILPLATLSTEAAMSERNDADVLIVGAGPVGLTLAIDLAQRGVSVALMEMRAAGEPPVGRSNVISARSMEAFRRLGIARAVREAGLPADYPHDVAIRTSATGLELGRVKIPCRAERYTAKGGPDTWWPTPEPPHRVNQIFLEPVLLGAAAATPRVRILNGMRVDAIEQREDQILATATESAGNATTTIAARYVVGCDGAHSRVRPAIGAVLQGRMRRCCRPRLLSSGRPAFWQ